MHKRNILYIFATCSIQNSAPNIRKKGEMLRL
nr:MAG TPA: hypothetical protein [Caudoviricetes sp.]